MFLIRMKQAWRGETTTLNASGEPERVPVIAKTRDVIEVDRFTMEALCYQRQAADPLTVDEIKEHLAQQEKKTKAPKKPAANKMVSESTQKES